MTVLPTLLTIAYEHAEMYAFLDTLDTLDVQEELGALAARERVCLLYYEADARECHRSLTAARLQKMELVGAVEDLTVPGR